jgi:signal transduction histidine kinase
VGLASYAAAAISGDDPNATGWQATIYSFRTALLPFVFIFNPTLLLIGVTSAWELLLVSASATVASLLFAAASMAWFRVRCNALEVALLLVACFLLFRPDWVVDRIQPRYVSAPAADLFRLADDVPPEGWLVVGIAGETIQGDRVTKTVALPMGDGANGRERIRAGGATVVALGQEMEVANVRFGSRARKLGVEQGFRIVEVKLPNPARPSQYWVFLPALLLVAFVWWLQGRRSARPAPANA